MILSYLKEILAGKDLYRIRMNQECLGQELGGLVLDVGSGDGASYHRFLKKRPEARVVSLDLKTGIDLEKDRLPYVDNSADTVLIFNLLEHLYNYRHLISEIKRVLRPGGKVIGAVPFLVGYHPDPHDFWRYTGESLKKVFQESGFKAVIKTIGWGPVAAGFSQVEFLCPRLVKILVVPVILFLDAALLKIKPALSDKFPLGFFFNLVK